MRIRTQLSIAVGSATVVAALVVCMLAYVVHRSSALLQAQRDSQEIARNVAGLLALTQEYTVYGGDRSSTQWRLRYGQLVQTVDRTVAREAVPHADLLAMREHVLDLGPVYDRLQQVYRGDNSDLVQRRREMIVERLVSESQELVEARYRWALAVGDRQARDQRWFSFTLFGGVAILMALVLGLAVLVVQRVLQPLMRLRAAAASIQQGDLATRCDETLQDELGDTGRAVNAMAESLLTVNQSLTAEVEQRRGAEARLRVVMESSPLGVFVGDAQGAFLYVNPAWQRISGVSADVALSAGGARTALHPDDREQALQAWRDIVADGRPQVHEHRYQRPDGEVVWVRRHAAPMRLEDGGLGVVCTVEDITERRRLDEALAARTVALRRSNEELERFAYVASHDLQEPLRMVASYSQLLERRFLGKLDGEAQEFLAYIVDGGKRAQALIGDLLRLARVESQAQPMVPVDLAAVLADALQVLRAPLQAAGAQVSFDVLPTVTGEPRQLSQLLQNLLGNALKFRGVAAPRIHVSAERDAALAAWRICVQDNGIGIDPRFHERIFVLFQRLHLRDEYEGTGIGLAICKKVVERHGGEIGVRSTPGAGATFHFTIPDNGRALPPGATSASRAAAPAATLAQRERQTA